MLYNYQPNSYTTFPTEQTSLIGYLIKNSDGSSNTVYLNSLSNAYTSARALTGPFKIFNDLGNYGKTGRYQFDISFAGTDKCLIWANSANSKATKTVLSSQLLNSKFGLFFN